MRRDAEHENMPGIPSETPGMEDEGPSCDIISRPDADDGRAISQRIEGGMNDLGVGSGLPITELVRSPIDDTPKVRLSGLGKDDAPIGFSGDHQTRLALRSARTSSVTDSR